MDEEDLLWPIEDDGKLDREENPAVDPAAMNSSSSLTDAELDALLDQLPEPPEGQRVTLAFDPAEVPEVKPEAPERTPLSKEELDQANPFHKALLEPPEFHARETGSAPGQAGQPIAAPASPVAEEKPEQKGPANSQPAFPSNDEPILPHKKPLNEQLFQAGSWLSEQKKATEEAEQQKQYKAEYETLLRKSAEKYRHLTQSNDFMSRALNKVFKPNILKLAEAKDVEALIQALEDGDMQVRGTAAEYLGELRDPRAVEPLLLLVLSEYYHAEWNDQRGAKDQWKAAYALRNLGDARMVMPLVFALQQSNALVRLRAAIALSGLSDVRAMDALIAALDDENPDTRDAAAKGLEKIGDGRAVKALLKTLEDRDQNVQESGYRALRKCFPQFEQRGSPPDEVQRVRNALLSSPAGMRVMWHDQEIVMRQREREYRSLIDKVEDLREEYQKLASRGTSFDFRMSEDRARSAMLKDSVSHLGDYARKVAQIQTEEAAAYLKSFYEWVWLHIYSVSDGGLYDVFNAVRLRERIVSAVSDLGESTGLDLLIEAMNRDDAINVVRAAVEVLEKRVMNTSSISAYQSGEVRSALRAALKKDEQESQRFRDSGYPADMASHKKAILAMLEKIG